MALGTTVNQNNYIGNDTAVTFSYSFIVWAKTQLHVVMTDPDGVSETLTPDTDFSYSGIGNTAGGSITLLGGALESGYTLVITRLLPLKQETSIRLQEEFYQKAHEDAFDKQVAIDQQQQRELNRCIKLIETDITGFDNTLPPVTSDDYGATIAINADGTGWQWGPNVSDIENLDQVAEDAAQAASDALEYATSAAVSETNAALSEAATASDATYCETVSNMLSLVQTDIKTSDYTASYGEFVRVDPSSGVVNITTPSPAAGQNGYRFGVKNVSNSSNAITVIGTIDDDTTFVMESAYECNFFATDGVSDFLVVN